MRIGTRRRLFAAKRRVVTPRRAILAAKQSVRSAGRRRVRGGVRVLVQRVVVQRLALRGRIVARTVLGHLIRQLSRLGEARRFQLILASGHVLRILPWRFAAAVVLVREEILHVGIGFGTGVLGAGTGGLTSARTG